jgi:hypothetical protein
MRCVGIRRGGSRTRETRPPYFSSSCNYLRSSAAPFNSSLAGQPTTHRTFNETSRGDNVTTDGLMKLNRTQVIGAALLAALVLLGLLLRYWKFSG